ncbi:tail fiber domain-containing protein [Xanthobacter autotrophicus]|uniref:tail fiber domain-containing protein n=1 Tax=Xanthobacter autotrophicus TaxID=280 RepID=UPI0024A63717|nr:tail fiber domain-containing protein [Xanthobacter autotrophicus]MDI4655524.1 tail fiber domain-containing protein [Xanthobacter autotrophicus]
MNQPEAPDPMQTALTQQAMNTSTANQQQATNMVNQSTPDYSLTYDQTGTRTYVDGFGRTQTVPEYTATQKLSDVNQGIYDSSKQAQGNMASTASMLSANAQSALSNPFKLGNEETEARLYELGSKRLDPQFAQNEEALRARLANSGIQAGSDAWNREMASFSQGRNDAYNSLLLNGRQLADQELSTERNSSLNELNALLTGSQIAAPNYVNTPQTQVAGVDYAGQVQNQYNQQVASNNAMMGGLFGLGGDILGAGVTKYSDPRLKRDVRRVGTLGNGLPVYAYRYVWGGPVEIGVMADEVEAVRPDAVHEVGGFKAVDYAKAVEA